MENVYAITGRGARVKHILNDQGVALCGQGKAKQPAVNRFAKLPVHSDCQEAAAAAEEDAPCTVHLSARVARYMSSELQERKPHLARALRSARKERNGRGYTAYVTAPQSTCTELLAEMDQLACAMRSGERTTRGMGFRAEAVIKGIEHITLGLLSIS